MRDHNVPEGVPVDPWTRAPLPAPPCACTTAPDDAALAALILGLVATRPQLRAVLAAACAPASRT